MSVETGSDRFRCPLIFTVTGLIAIAVLGYDGQQIPVAVGLGVIFIIPYLTKLRIPDSAFIVWTVRLIVLTIVFQLTRSDYNADDIADPRSVTIMGFVAAAEMVMQCWRARPDGHPPGMVLIFLAGSAYLGACYTNDLIATAIIQWVTPAFFLLLVLSWRRIEAQTLHDPLSLWAKFVYCFVLLCAVGVGFGVHWAVHNNRDEFNRLAQSLMNGANETTETGMSDQPQLSSTFGLQGSPERVLLISGDLSEPHLRALSFDNYFHGTWGPPGGGRSFVAAPPQLGSVRKGSRPIVVTRLRFASGMIYAPLDSDSLDLSQQIAVKWSPQNAGPILSDSSPPSDYSFTETGTQAGLLSANLAGNGLSADLIVSQSISPRVKLLAQKLVAGKRDSAAKVQAICAGLDAQHRYSLSYTEGAGDPVSGFILSNKPAHCEFFASAAVILLRCIGIPARYVIGYYAHERNSVGNIVVRQRDAHAWAEAYVNGQWTTVDATPASGQPPALYGSIPWWQQVSEAVQDRIGQWEQKLRQIGPRKEALLLLMVPLLFFAIRLAVREWRNRRVRTANRHRAARQDSVYADRFHKVMARYGFKLNDDETWLEFLARQSDVPFDRSAAQEFVAVYNGLRFGEGDGAGLDDLLARIEGRDRAKELV